LDGFSWFSPFYEFLETQKLRNPKTRYSKIYGAVGCGNSTSYKFIDMMISIMVHEK